MPLLDIENLTVSFPQHEGVVQAVRGVSLSVAAGESVGIVGESGSGKSVTCMAVLRLLREPPARIAAEKMELAGVNMLTASRAQLSASRGRVAAMVFQDPMTAFDPVFTIGHQIVETIRAHRKVSKSEARGEAANLLARVEIKTPEAILNSYPHQLSGGMLQRAMIAMALSCRPQILFADEPTTALDVTIQAQILQLIKDLQAEFGMGLIMVTHDLGVVAETVDRVVVMYGGRVMETAPVQDIFDAPAHPYTQALMASMPGRSAGKQRLVEIPGASPNPSNPPSGCPFHPRCAVAEARCAAQVPAFKSQSATRAAACWRLP
ncbi:MAG: ABC transporter ATP-binding protein [Cypionkella sp.]|uniref:ABC transporter ATP-binding protein n=1 Tax=Cypionkella sp. TaxID=2811411 RepID=UPI00272351DD|nr:ABC transporter ATP-binding protein [Cypionkella sp.]MDO8328128.1 ABC transporter ATP-binding protein [Cypionkella sp.]